jgi:DNA-binding transcriptional ArsR family regulator
MAMNHSPADARRQGRPEPRAHDVHRHGALGPDADDLATSARLFHGLADPGRLRILRHLQLGEHRVVDLTAHLGLAQSTVSAHLACLRDCGLLDVRHEGRSSWYRLARPERTEALLAAGEALLAATPEEVV